MDCSVNDTLPISVILATLYFGISEDLFVAGEDEDVEKYRYGLPPSENLKPMDLKYLVVEQRKLKKLCDLIGFVANEGIQQFYAS
jgi:hypothetical protein